MAGFDVPPANLLTYVRAGLAAVSTLLVGAAVVCFVASNWSEMGRPLQFGLLEAMVLLPCLGAAFIPKGRVPLALFAFLAIGALFAYFGQTYQTGADPWQLFALWSALGLPLVATVRSETIRVAWIAIAMTGLALWTSGAGALLHEALELECVLGSAAALLLALSLSRPFQRYTGAGSYASSVAIVCALGLASANAWAGINSNGSAWTSTILIGLIVMVATFYARSHFLDILALCACALSLNFLIDTVIVCWMLKASNFDIAALLIIGVAATGLCGISISAIFAIMRQHLSGKGAQ